MIADKNAQYELADVDLNDGEFIQSLTPAQFAELFGEALQQPGGEPADLAGPKLRRSGEAVVMFGPPTGSSSRRGR